MITDAQSIAIICNYTHHDHLYFSSSRSVFTNNIIQENDFCQLHGQVIFITARRKFKGYSNLLWSDMQPAVQAKVKINQSCIHLVKIDYFLLCSRNILWSMIHESQDYFTLQEAKKFWETLQQNNVFKPFGNIPMLAKLIFFLFLRLPGPQHLLPYTTLN